MNEAGIGRLLVASLHQGIADLLPTRLEFYEAWLNPSGLRDGRIGLARSAAVLSFLRQEGEAVQADRGASGRVHRGMDRRGPASVSAAVLARRAAAHPSAPGHAPRAAR